MRAIAHGLNEEIRPQLSCSFRALLIPPPTRYKVADAEPIEEGKKHCWKDLRPVSYGYFMVSLVFFDKIFWLGNLRSAVFLLTSLGLNILTQMFLNGCKEIKIALFLSFIKMAACLLLLIR